MTLTKEQLLAIERPQTRCSGCDALIEELDHHPTGLAVKDDEEPKRFDYCPDCWEKMKAEAYEGYWETRRVKKEKKVPKLSRREKSTIARALFESLWEAREREDLDAHLYFIAHLLLKWGGLKWRGVRTDANGREHITFENPTSGDTIEVKGMELSEEAIAEIRDRVEAFLRDHAPENDVLL